MSTQTQTQTISDLSLFVFDRTNRKRSKKALREVRRSANKIGLRTDLFPVVVQPLPDGTFKVLDGQHRVMVAREMGEPVTCVLSDEVCMDDVATINQAQTPWSMDDHVRHYAEQGNVNYARIIGLMNEHDVSAHVATVALGQPAYGPIKAGEIVVSETEMAGADRLLSRCNDFAETEANTRFHGFVKALKEICALPGYDHARMTMRAERYGIEPKTSSGHYVRELLRVYNTRTPNELRISHPRYGDGS